MECIFNHYSLYVLSSEEYEYVQYISSLSIRFEVTLLVYPYPVHFPIHHHKHILFLGKLLVCVFNKFFKNCANSPVLCQTQQALCANSPDGSASGILGSLKCEVFKNKT